MKNTFGNSLGVTLFGESHGEMIGAVIDGIAPGIEIDEEYIAARMAQRSPFGKISTSRRESDEVRIVSGVFGGRTTGTPLCILIENRDTRSGDYEKDLPRPAHADFTARVKYHGFEDYRGGGHFSGRLTAPLVAAGAIVQKALEGKGIFIGTHIKKCREISDRDFGDIEADISSLSSMQFAVLDKNASESMICEIEKAAGDGDSIGAVLESAVIGLPAGVGEPWFDTLEGVISHAVFSIPAVKGIEFGDGFALASLKGSEANDAFCLRDGKVCTATNHSGGINGGISNGMPVIFRTAIKPTPSIFKEQQTVDLERGEETTLRIGGRHDPAIFHRARVVIDAVTALALADMLALHYGTDWLGGGGDVK